MKAVFHFLFVTSFFWILPDLSGQLVVADPFFPQIDQAVTITFDATEGSGGLAGFTGDVYAHTGVITSNSSGPSDWKYVKTDWGENTPATKLTRIGEDLYTLTIVPTIRTYYGIPGGEEVLQLAFVFRSASEVGGSYLEGKTADFGDIFVDMSSDGDLVLAVLSLQQTDFLVDPGETIGVQAVTSKNADIEIRHNGNLLQQATGVTSLSAEIDAPQEGSGTITVDAVAGPESESLQFYYAVVMDPVIEDVPAGTLLGINHLDDTSLRLLLEAPGKENVYVRGDFTGWRLEPAYQMKKSPDGRYFWLEINELNSGQFYRFQYVVDQTLYVADPLSEVVLDPNHDPWITEDIFPGLPEFPEEAGNVPITLVKMGGYAYNWQHTDFVPPPSEDLVIYECLVRDFIGDHSYATLADTLDYLVRLGVNAIQLMPPSEFEGNISWGYNVSFHMAIDKYYGNPGLLKAFIDEAHGRGIAVLFDVVFNHTFGQSPHARLYWDSQSNRPAADNPWLNPVPRHPFNVGNDYNHESQSTRDYVNRTLRYLFTEYRIDGVRFDLAKGFTQRFSNDDGQMRLYDANRIATIELYTDAIREVNPAAYVTLEHFAENLEQAELSDYGIMIWGNRHNEFKDASLGYHENGKSDFSWGYFAERGWSQPNLITYMESHDEQRIMYENLNYGNESGAYRIQDFETALDRIELANVFLFAIPGPKIFQQFAELGYDYSLNYCIGSGTENPDCKTQPKPIRWDYREVAGRADLFDVFRDMIYLKTNTSLNDAEIVSAEWRDAPKMLKLDGPETDAVVVGNFAVTERGRPVTFTGTGTWYEYFSGDSIEISSPFQEFQLEPGEYRLYLNRKIERPSGNTTAVRDLYDAAHFGLEVFPNPVGDQPITLAFDPEKVSPGLLRITDGLGRVLWNDRLGPEEIPAGKKVLPFRSVPGMYYLIYSNQDGYAVLPLLME